MLPAVPWLIPGFTCRPLVGHGAGPPSEDVAAGLAGAVAPEVLLAGAVTVLVAVGPAAWPADVPQAATSAAMLSSAAAAVARRAAGGDEVIAVSFCAGWRGGSLSRVTGMTLAR